MDELERLEQAVARLEKALEKLIPQTKAQPAKSGPTKDSNGVPVCSIHGKAMFASKFKEGQYYCGFKLDDGKYCREKA